MDAYEINPPDRFVFPELTPLHQPPEAKREGRYRAHLWVECDLGVGARAYALRIWNNHLYFTESPQSLSSPVWSCLHPVDETAESGLEWLNRPEALLEWWRGEVLNGKFGVVSGNGQNEWNAVILWGCDGMGQYRTWWDDRSGVPFEWPKGEFNTRAALLSCRMEFFHDSVWAYRSELLRTEEARSRKDEGVSAEELAGWQLLPPIKRWMEDTLNNQRVLERHRQEEPLSWRRGDAEAALRLATATMHLDEETWIEISRVGGGMVAAHPFGPARLRFLDEEGDVQLLSDAYTPRCRGDLLLSLVIRDFDPVGWVWDNRSEPSHSRSWNCKPYRWEWAVTSPSQHEKVEALLILRDWLERLKVEGMISAADVELLLDWPESVSREEYREIAARINPPVLDG